MKAIRLAAAAATVTSAPIVSTSGRSPSAIGSSCARTASFFISERETRCSGCARGTGRAGAAGSARRLRLRLPTEGLRCRAWIVGVADRAHDGNPLGVDGGRALRVDAADREPRHRGVLLRVLDEL